MSQQFNKRVFKVFASYFLLAMTLLSYASCQSKAKEEEPNLQENSEEDGSCWTDYFEFCTESKQNKVKQSLKQDVKTLMDALVANDIEKASKYATYYGLGTLLYLNIAEIKSYSIERIKHIRPQAFVYMKVNGSDEVIPFFFGKKGGKWRFEGIDMYDLLDGNHIALHYRRKVQSKRPRKATDTTTTKITPTN